MAAAKATVEGIKAIKNGGGKGVKSLQQFHSEIE
jgi:carbamoyl-phosphate synthase large subunit